MKTRRTDPRSWLTALVFAPMVLLGGACAATAGADPDAEDPIEEIDEAALIDAYVRGLPHLPADPPAVVEGPAGTPSPEGDYQCVSQDLSETRQYDKIVAYAANSDSLWPGAMVAGDSVYTGLFTQMVLPRQPATISVSLENLAGDKSAVLEQPSLSSFRDAVTGILQAEVTGATPANIYSEIEQVHSDEQLALALGAEVSWLGSSASIAASFDFSQSSVRSRYLVKYTQAYYTVDLDAPGKPSDLLAPEVTLADVETVMNAENPPLFVSSVTYGRMVVFTFESDYSAEELNAALEFTYSGGVDVSGNVSVSYRDIISSSKITAFILGGSGGEAARTIDSYEALLDFIRDGGDYSRQSPGAPIAYKLAYLGDNSPGRLSFTTDYTITECERVSQKVKVTLKSIRVEDDGGDYGDDLELYGTIYAESNNRVNLFSRGESSNVTIRQGEAWPTGGFISETIINVTPQPGNRIRLGASLIDYDPTSANDSMGNELVDAPFELGWRRDLNILLTGDDARIVVTVGLTPI